jgi:hypothetical protein
MTYRARVSGKSVILTSAMSSRRAVSLCLVLGLSGVVLAGCSYVAPIFGMEASDPSVNIPSAQTKWLLIKNPRFGDVASEPEYIWVEEDKLPFSLKRLVLGTGSILAPPEVVARYGRPPGGGQISSRQRVAQNVEAQPTPAQKGKGAGPAAAPAPAPPRGYVVFVDTTRIVIDLTAKDGVEAGRVVSLRRDKIPIIHPVTGELLGELDEEVATGKVIEVRDRFSVVEIENVSPGAEIKVKDRVVPR